MQISRTYPTFFGGLFGLGTRTLSASTTGKLAGGGGGPVIHASAGCGVGFGFTIQGSGSLNVTGNIESNGILNLGWMAGPVTIPGTLKSPCAGQPQDPFNFVTTEGPGGPFPDPFLGVTFATLPACTQGNLGAAWAIPVGDWALGAGVGGADKLVPGVYCSGGGLAIASPWTPNIDITGCTFLAVGGIQFGASGSITSTNSPAVPNPNNIVAMSTLGGGCGAPAINIGTATRFNMQGSLYAPLGCINGGGGDSGWSLSNGRVVGDEVNLSMAPGAVWTITGGGGGGGSGWSLFQ
jgi:hypothetical protein